MGFAMRAPCRCQRERTPGFRHMTWSERSEDTHDLAAADRELASGDDDLHALHQMIATLEPINRALILLYLEGYGQEEIAELIGLTATNVATRIGRIKQQLQRDHAATEKSS